MKLRAVFCLILALVLFSAVPCAAAEPFNRLETLPTQYSDIDYWEFPDISPLQGKSVVFFGDSLCYSSIDRSTLYGDANVNTEEAIYRAGYAGRIATKYNMDLQSLGVRGATIAQNTVNQGVIYKTIENAKNSNAAASRNAIDYVILEGGVNDVTAKVPLGVLGDETSNFDKNTFAGALQYTITLAKETYPNATIGFLVMYQMPAAANSLRNDLTNAGKYMQMIKDVCNKWDIPYLDFFFDQKFNNNVFNVSKTSGAGACLGTDGVHMTVHGYDVLTPYIASWMSSPYREEPKPEETTAPTPAAPIETPDTDTPPADPPTANDQNPNMGLIIGIAGGSGVAVITAVTVSAVVLHKKKKKKQQSQS